MKYAIKQLAYKTLLRPPYVHHCSQTLYEALLGCCRMWEATKNPVWKRRAGDVFSLLVSAQKEDGGFDIGYDFNFGMMHKKGESTSPELVGLLAICEYGSLFDKEAGRIPAEKAISWIKTNVQKINDSEYAMPYAPYSTKRVMVYNGTSFAVGALGKYLGVYGDDGETTYLYRGMIKYLYSSLRSDDRYDGKFWFYSDQKRDDLTDLQRVKIDYYHQMQQVEMHSLAQQSFFDHTQSHLIIESADHIVSIFKDTGFVPYTNNNLFFGGRIHTWGLSSVISGFMEASQLCPDRGELYRSVAAEIYHWIRRNCWNGKYFYAVMTPSGSKVPPDTRMVRSDAWVFNSMSAYYKFVGDDSWPAIAEQCYETMARSNFSGPESHASNFRNRLTSKLISKIRKK